MAKTGKAYEERTMVKLPVLRLEGDPITYFTHFNEWVKINWGKAILVLNQETAEEFMKRVEAAKNTTVDASTEKYICVDFLEEGFVEFESIRISAMKSFYVLKRFRNEKERNFYQFPTNVIIPNDLHIISFSEKYIQSKEVEALELTKVNSYFDDMVKWAEQSSGQEVLMCDVYTKRQMWYYLRAAGVLTTDSKPETAHDGVLRVNFLDGKKIKLRKITISPMVRIYVLKELADSEHGILYTMPTCIESVDVIKFKR